METFLIAVHPEAAGWSRRWWGCRWLAYGRRVLHAAWTLVTAGMLAMAFEGRAARGPGRIMPAPRPFDAEARWDAGRSRGNAIAAPIPKPRFPWFGNAVRRRSIAMAFRLAYGYRLTRKLRCARAVRSPRFASEPCTRARAYRSLTVGWLRPRIFCPRWDAWAPEKLEAYWSMSGITPSAAIGRSHFGKRQSPVSSGFILAWWLEARLKVLAEEACDDACLQQVASRESYAQVLVEMAAAVRSDTGRAIAMAKEET